MPKRGPRDPDRKGKKAVRDSLQQALSIAEFDQILQIGKEALGLHKLHKVIKDQEELNQRAAKKAKVEDFKQEDKAEIPVKEESANSSANSSSSNICTNTELQKEFSKCTGRGTWQ